MRRQCSPFFRAWCSSLKRGVNYHPVHCSSRCTSLKRVTERPADPLYIKQKFFLPKRDSLVTSFPIHERIHRDVGIFKSVGGLVLVNFAALNAKITYL